MNIIKESDWDVLAPRWENWEGFKPTDPKVTEKLQQSRVYVQLKRQKKFSNEDSYGFYEDRQLRGCVTIFWKAAPGLLIAGIGRMAVDPLYRRNGIASALLRAAVSCMYERGNHISILWASVPAVYEASGYSCIYKNMMYRPILGLPQVYNINDLINLPQHIGTF